MIERTACMIGQTSNIYHNQAVEMQLMEDLPRSTAYLYLYEAGKTVLQGRIEDTREACWSEALTGDGGLLARRVSGGSSCYLDQGVLSFALILPKPDFNIPRQLALLTHAISSLGIPVAQGARGKLGIQGRYFCQSYFYKNEKAALHHGLIYCDADLGKLPLYTQSKEVQKAVSLAQINPRITIGHMEAALFQTLGECYDTTPVWMDERLLRQNNLVTHMEKFHSRRWIWKSCTDDGFRAQGSFPWGNIEVQLAEQRGIIQTALIRSDAMEAEWLMTLEKFLIGAPFLISAITSRLTGKQIEGANPHLRMIAGDVCILICSHIRQSNRLGEESPSMPPKES